MRVYLYLLLSGRTCNWLYALSTRITLHGGPEKWQKWGRAKRVLSRFCREEKRKINFEILGNLRKRAPLSFYVISGDFLLLLPPYLFTVHIRPVLSPCQAGNTYCILSCFFKNVYNIVNTIFTHNMYIALFVAPLFLLWDHRILLDFLLYQYNIINTLIMVQ